MDALADPNFLTFESEFVLFLAVLENCLAHGLRQPTRDVRTINFRSDVTFASPRKIPNGECQKSLRKN